MDIQLPLLDGYEVTRRLKADPAARHPVIAVTSYALSDDEGAKRAARAATPMSASPTARARCWRRSASMCHSASRFGRPR
jgi:CheY-like chemotaxis protein